MATTMRVLLAIFACAFVLSVSPVRGASEGEKGEHPSLPGNRTFLGTVEEVRSDQARINTGEGQPRFVPMNVRKDKGLADLKKRRSGGDHSQRSKSPRRCAQSR